MMAPNTAGLNGISGRLALNGVLPYDAGAYLFDTKSQLPQMYPQMFNAPVGQDGFNKADGAAGKKTKGGWDTFGKVVLASAALVGGAFAMKKFAPETLSKITKPIIELGKKIFKK